MKILNITILLLICLNYSQAQVWYENIQEPTNYYSIKKAYLEHLEKSNSEKLQGKEEISDGEVSKFRRWEHIVEPRVFPSGKLPNAGNLLYELNAYKLTLDQDDTLYDANWTSLESPEGFPVGGFSGRLNCIAFHPSDSNTFFVGAPCGGLWKTEDGGRTWSTNTDNFPSLGLSEIVINPKNPDIMYIATGDRDAAYFISNPYSYGILKSTDGGKSWDTTGLSHLNSEQMTIQRLLMKPDEPQVLLAAVGGVTGNKKGIWRTSDAGKTWVQTAGGAKYDIEFHPTNPNIVYASGWKSILKSTDAGKTWTGITSDVLPTTPISYAKIAVTPAMPNGLFVQYLNPNTGGSYGLYKSSDEGKTWIALNFSEITLQGGYDWVLAASPIDSNIILYGGQYLYGTFTGGKTQVNLQSGHVDHHDLVYSPLNKALYNCNDGGLYKSYDNGKSWFNLNKGLQTFQFYRLGSSTTNSKLILTGAQDNGTQKHNGKLWYQFGQLADGMECIYDYSDPNIYYSSYQYGYLNRFGGGAGFTFPPTAGNASFCAWVTPYLIHPTNPQVLFFGAKDIYKTNNRGNSWTSYSSQLTANDNVGGGMLRTMAISESQPDEYLYAASYVEIYKTSDGGKSWKSIKANLNLTAGCFECSAIGAIAVDPTNAKRVLVGMSGYLKGSKVFETTDGGDSWSNISENLPNIPVNTIVFQKDKFGVIYLGTDMGVFYKTKEDSKWKPFMNGLPNVPVSELEIHNDKGLLRAATFGRGLWESNLYGVPNDVEIFSDENGTLSPNPANDFIQISNYTENENIEVFSPDGMLCLKQKATKFINISMLNPGIYFLKRGERIYKFIKI